MVVLALIFFTWISALKADGLPDEIASLKEELRQLQQVALRLQARVERLESAREASPAAAFVAQSENPRAPASVEGNKLGPIRFDGEFRLYFDSLTRHEGGGAPRVQNIRGRYLLHLDFSARLNSKLTFNGRLSTAPITNELTDIQDFAGGVTKHPFFLSHAYIDYRPNPYLTLQGGRLDSPFNDKSRFLFDIDTRFNGTTEIVRIPFKDAPFGFKSIQFLAGQYIFTNPNLPIIPAGTASTAATATPQQALLAAGTTPGTQPRVSALFQQGFIADQSIGSISQQAQFDMQIYRNPNQLRLLSTAAGAFLVGGGIGITPSGPQPTVGNATTTPTGAVLNASAFRVAHVSYTIAHGAVPLLNRNVPISLNLQVARNTATHSARDAFAAILTAGRSKEHGDVRVIGAFYRKQANSLISELTENDIAINSNVNMNAYVGRFEYTFTRAVSLANDLIWTNWIRSSDPAANFFVPLGNAVPTQFRYQATLIFKF